jgi:hypothetical protein
VRNPLTWFAAAVVAAAPVAAGADVYKWTNEGGVATYGERPPARARNVTRLTMEAGNVSIIPVPKPRAVVPPQPRGESAPEVRAGLLSGSGPIGADDSTRIESWRKQCVAERRVDCDDPTAATFDVAPSFGRIAPR